MKRKKPCGFLKTERGDVPIHSVAVAAYIEHLEAKIAMLNQVLKALQEAK